MAEEEGIEFAEVGKGNNGKNEGDGFSNFALPHTENHCSHLVVKVTVAPNTCCFPCWYFHPVKGIVSIDGVEYEWNSRAHRKLRHMWGPAEKHPKMAKNRIVFLGWEPHIVTWWNVWIGEVANTLWVINGMYATWPELRGNSEIISYVTGVLGAFMFIITGYLGYVEAINHSHRAVTLPEDDVGQKRSFSRPLALYGKWPHPLLSTGEHLDEELLLEEGYPLVQDVKSGELVTGQMLTRYTKTHPDLSSLIGLKLDIRANSHVFHVTVDGVGGDASADKGGELVKTTREEPSETAQGYRWWTWNPDMHQISIFLAIIYFTATIIFFIAATVWYPQDKNRDPSLGSTIFWQQVLQIIPCVGFIVVGHCSMAEASGSWWKPDFWNIGWWISLFNTIGSYGFMVYAIIAIWGLVDFDRYAGLMKWGADLGTFWGSCAFWVAGFLACFEFGSKHPIKVS